MSQPQDPLSLPIIDVSALRQPSADRQAVAREIRAACTQHGFFYVRGHGVPQALIDRLDALSHDFFSRPEDWKLQWNMARGGRAWRGYFRAGDELTSNRPDWKEGIYFGQELDNADSRVRAGLPLHGHNLFPELPGLREAVLDYMQAVTALGHRLMEGIALSLDLPADYFDARYTKDPLILFRIFNYPSRPAPEDLQVRWGVGEHTDYGLLTILRQDDVGGLQVKTPQGWIEAPPLAGTFVCNIGDMLDHMTGGLYRSTPHRVAQNTSGHDRLSFPLFFDPNFTAEMKRIDGLTGARAVDDNQQRWDQANVHAFHGQYGDYLLAKVSKVFPQLKRTVL